MAIAVNDGTAALPSMKFSGTTTGFFRDGTGVGTTVDGVRRSYSYLSGRVGYEHSGGTAGYQYSTRKSRGTSASPVIVNSGDALGHFIFSGYDGNDYRDVAEIRAEVDGSPGASDMPTRLRFYTCPDGSITRTERMRIDSAGRVGINCTPSIHRLELARTASSNDAIGLFQFSAGADDSYSVNFYRSRNTTIGSHTVVQSGDRLGSIVFRGSDGANYIDAANIRGEVDGTPGTNDMPGRLTFYTTPDGSNVPLERMRIDNAGRVGINCTPSAGRLEIARTESSDYGVVLAQFSEGASEAVAIDFYKSRNTTIGSHTVVQDGDRLGSIVFRGSDGASWRAGANIRAEVDGTPGSSDMPGRLLFLTTSDGSATLTERMRITSDGSLYAYTLSSGAGTNALKYDTGTKEITYDSSDARVKSNFEDFNYGLSEVLRIAPKFFDHYDCTIHPRSGELVKGKHFNRTGGFVAQEVHAVAPRAVHAPEQGLWNVNDRVLLAMLWKAVQELNEKFEGGETSRAKAARELESLKEAIKNLEAKL